MESKNNRIGKKAAKIAIAATTGASLIVGSAYASPEDLINPKPIIETLNTEDSNEEETDHSDKKMSVRFRKWFSSMPIWTRVVFGLPLWFIGATLLYLGSTVWETILSPALSTIIVILLIGILLMGTLAACGKMLLPNVPFRKFFNRKALFTIAGGIGAYLFMDNVFPKIWESYSDYSKKILITTFIITLICGLYQYWHDLHETKLVISTDQFTFES